MKTNIVIEISLPPYIWQILVLHLWAKMLKDSLKCNILRKKWVMKFIFGMQISIEVFYKLILSFWVCVARHAQSTQNNKFSISLENCKKNVKDEVDFKPAYKHQRIIQVDTIILGLCGQACSNYPKQEVIQYYFFYTDYDSMLLLCNILRKKWVMKSIFCMRISMKFSCNLILWFLMGGCQLFPKFPK